MSYEAAKNKAWDQLFGLGAGNNFQVKFLADTYAIDLAKKTVESLSCNVPARDFAAVLILHYLVQRIKGLEPITGEWLPFRELAGIEGYADAFRKRAILPIIAKYGADPAGIFSVLERLPAKKSDLADCSIIIEAFEGVPALVRIMKADKDFAPEANLLFDRSLAKIFCIEDIIVLAGVIAASI